MSIIDKPIVKTLMLKGEKGDPGDLDSTAIVDNLTTNRADKVLSAKQGKVLKDLVDANKIVSDHGIINLNSALDLKANTADVAIEYATKESVNDNISSLDAKVNSLASGSPLVASSVSGMTQTDKVYVNTSDGKWYYYDGDSWEDGGIYQSTSFQQDFDNLMDNINLPNGKLFGNKINEYGIDYRFLNDVTVTKGRMSGWNTETYLPKIKTTEADLNLGIINIDFAIPTSGKITFPKVTTGTFYFYLYKENVQGHALNVGSSGSTWGPIIGYTVDDNNITLDFGKIKNYNGGYERVLIMQYETNPTLISDEYQIPLPDYIKNTSPIILTLKQDSTGDFTSLRQASEYIINNPKPQGYELHIYPGEYDVLSDYTQTEINNAHYDGNASSFCGIIINNFNIKGIGNKDNIIIKGELDPDLYNSNIRLQISTLNLIGNCKIENLTITSKYIRYAIHDDFNNNANKTHIINNCNIVNILATNMVSRGIAYGIGTKSGEYIEVNNCEINPSLGHHNNTNFTDSYNVEINNSKILQYITLGDGNSVVNGYFTLNNTTVNYILYELNEGLTKQYTILKGNSIINTPIISNTNLIRYYFGNVIEGLTDALIGKCVKRITSNYYSQARGINIDGVYLFNENGIKYIQTSGYIQTNLLTIDTSNWQLGDLLKVGDDGYLTKTTNNDDAVAVVAIVENNNKLIKLL